MAARYDGQVDLLEVSCLFAAVYNLTKFGVNGFTEALHQEVTQRHVRVGVLEPGGVATELGSHNDPRSARR